VSIIVQSNSRLSYIGHTSFVIGGRLQRQLLSKDGLHLSRSGAATVVRDLPLLLFVVVYRSLYLLLLFVVVYRSLFLLLLLFVVVYHSLYLLLLLFVVVYRSLFLLLLLFVVVYRSLFLLLLQVRFILRVPDIFCQIDKVLF
jgi:hypothetical protein